MTVVDVAQQYIEFKLGNQNYAVKMKYVREIIKPLDITSLLGSPDFVKGVSRVRDHVITIIDLRNKFKIELSDLTKEEPRIVILEHEKGTLGLYVDDVVEILESSSVEQIPNMVHHGVIQEIIKLEESLTPILDVNKLFTEDVTTWLNS